MDDLTGADLQNLQELDEQVQRLQTFEFFNLSESSYIDSDFQSEQAEGTPVDSSKIISVANIKIIADF